LLPHRRHPQPEPERRPLRPHARFGPPLEPRRRHLLPPPPPGDGGGPPRGRRSSAGICSARGWRLLSSWRSSAMSLLVVGSVALDNIETPYGERRNALGGAASYFS